MRLHRAQPCIESVRARELPQHREGCGVGRIVGECQRAHRRNGVRLAEDLRRDALRQLADIAPVAVEKEIAGLSLDVDEPGRDDHPRRIDALERLRVAELSSSYNANYSISF